MWRQASLECKMDTPTIDRDTACPSSKLSQDTEYSVEEVPQEDAEGKNESVHGPASLTQMPGEQLGIDTYVSHSAAHIKVEQTLPLS